MKQRKHKGLQRMLAMLFAVVMVVTSVPQTAMGAYAAETGFLETVSSIETVSEMTEGAEEESGAEEVELISEEAKTEEITSEEFETESTTTQEVMPEEEMIQEVTSELEEIWVEETVLRPSIQAEGNGDDGSVSVNDVYTFTFVPDEHVTIYDEDGINEITELTVPVGSGDEMYFTVKMDEGYTVQSVRHNIDKTYLTISRRSSSLSSCKYRILPGKRANGVYTSDAEITVNSTLIADYTASFDFDTKAVEFSALVDGEAVALTDGALTVSNTESLSFLLKEKEGYKITSVTYTTENVEEAYDLAGYDDDEDGYYEYSVGRMFENYQITISTKAWEECTINFETEHLGLSQAFFYHQEDDSTDYYTIYHPDEYMEIYLGNSIRVGKNEPFYFAITTAPEKYTALISTTGDEKGALTQVGTTDEGYPVYTVTPTGNMKITAKAKPAVFKLEYDDNLIEDIYFTYDSYEEEDYPAKLTEDKKGIEILRDISFTLYVKPKRGKSIYSMYRMVENTEDGNKSKYREYTEVDENGYYFASFSTSDYYEEKTLYVGIEESCTLTFNAPRAVIGNFSTGETIDNSVECAVGVPFTFVVTPEERYGVVYVTTTGDERGKLEEITEEITEDGEVVAIYSYYKVIPTEDMTFSVLTEAINKQIMFANECEVMEYTVTSEVIEEGDYTPSGDCYYINKDAKQFTFDVTVNDANALPYVMLRNNKGKDTVLQGSMSTNESGNHVYTYVIAATLMTEEMTIYISDANAPKLLTLKYDSNSLNYVTLTVDGEEITPVSVSGNDIVNCATYEVEKNKTVVLSAKAGERYSISAVNVDDGMNQLTYEVLASSYSGSIFMDVNTFVSIVTRGKVFTTVSQVNEDGREIVLEPFGVQYIGKVGTTYKATIVCGDTPVQLTEIRTSNLRDTIETQICEEDTGSFLITIPEDYTRSSTYMKVRGTIDEANGRSRNVTATVSFRIMEEVEAVKVTAPRTNFIPDAYVTYRYTTTTSRGTLANTGVEITVEEGISEDLVTYTWRPALNRSGTLRICASAKAGYGKIATIRLYRKDLLPSDDNYYIEGSEIVYEVTEPTALFESTPTAKVVASDDVSMTLQLDDEYRKTCVNGRQYYKVEVIPQTVEGVETPATITEACANPFFVVREFPEYDEEGNEIPGFVQKEKIILNTVGTGLGKAWKYNVKVTLVQTYDKTALTAENAGELIAFSSKTLDMGTVETKDPAFSAKLTLQKKTTQVYTTQNNVIAANVKYDKGTVCADALATDITECAENEKLIVKVDNGQLVVSASSRTKLGKHTIQVSPIAPSTLYRQDATITVTVVKAIEKLQVALPSDTIYKKTNKEANMTVSAVYNEGSDAPKTKKVTWELLDEEGNPLNVTGNETGDEAEEDAMEEKHPLSGLVSISKAGKVTVNKKVDVSESSQAFRIKVTADDFAGNTTTAISDVITISNQPLELGEMLIVKKNEALSLYTVVAKNGDTVTTDKLQNAQLVVLHAGETVKASYTEEDLQERRIAASQLSVKSSAAKSIALTKEENDILITSGKPAKDIKLTVTTNDGGKKSKTIKVTIGYTKPDALALSISEGNAALNELATDELSVSFNGTVNTKLDVSVMQKTGGADWDELYAYTNHTLEMKGGKIISSDAESGKYTIVVSGAKATLTLKDKVNSITKKYTITNNNYSVVKAPTVKIKAKTPGNIVCGVLANRSLQYQITSKTYSTTDKYVMIEPEAAAAEKKPVEYATFTTACDKVGVYTSVTDGNLVLNFDDSNIPLGNYKLTLTFGTKNGDTFVVDAKPVTVTVKVVKAKVTKGSYKANATYSKVEANAGTEIVLKGKSSNLHSVTYTNIMGANVKGMENKFLEYFRLENNKLIIREDLTEEQITALKKSKTDNYGYLTYTAVYGDNGYGVPFTETKTVKVTIKFKK